MAILSQEDKKWRTESDARCIRNYLEICNDKERMDLAQEYLKEQQAKTEAALASMQVTKNIQSATGRNGG